MSSYNTSGNAEIDGGSYQGELKDYEPYGEGTLTYEDGRDISRGTWRDEELNGMRKFKVLQLIDFILLEYAERGGNAFIAEWKDGKAGKATE